MIIHPSQEYFDFTWATVGKPEISRTTIRIPIRNFGVARGYTSEIEDKHFDRCILVYGKVIASIRIVYGYEDQEHKIFKTPYTIYDGPFDTVTEPACGLSFQAYSEEFVAWVDWMIIAVSAQIEENEI